MHKNDLRRASNVFTFDQKMPTDQNLMTKKFLVFDSLPDGKQFIPGFPFYLSVEKDRAKCRQGGDLHDPEAAQRALLPNRL